MQIIDGSVTNNGNGTFTTTINVCLGITENHGGTNNFSITAGGGSFSNFVSLTTSSINSSYKTCVCGGGGTCSGATVNVTATANGTFTVGQIDFALSSSVPSGNPFSPYADDAYCPSLGNPIQLCWNITFVTNGYPDSVKVFNIEDDVNPQGGIDPCGSDTTMRDFMPTIPCNTLNVTATNSNAGCLGVCDGDAKIISVTNGGSPFTYSFDGGAFSALDSFNNLCVGSHVVQIKDKDGCPVTYSFFTNPSFEILLSSSATQINCAGQNTGTITLTPSPANPLYQYNWSDGSTVQNPTNLFAGVYNVTVTDDNNCIAYDTVTVTEKPALTVATTTNPADCGSFNGSASAVVSGGTSPFSYLWSNGDSTQTSNNLSPGTYNVTVTDVNGCTNNAVALVTDKNDIQIFFVAKNNVSCNGQNDGMLQITYTGSNSPTVLWSNGATTDQITNLAPGTYTATVTNTIGCSATFTDSIVENSTLTDTLTFGYSPCAGANAGFINTDVSGGTFPSVSYDWSNGVNGAAGISNLGPGFYSVTITDANGCSRVDTQTITEPLPIVLTASSVNSTCGNSDGTAIVNASGGTPGYTYLWNPSGQTTDTATNIPSGIYNVDVTDANGCVQSSCVEVNDNLAPTISNIIVRPVTCSGANDGSIDITVTGGTPIYTYTWSNGETTQDIDSLGAGTYTVTVTDQNGCKAFMGCNNNDLVVPQPFSISTSASPSDCDVPNGSAFVTANGGTAPYFYLWQTSPIQNTDTAFNLFPGDYLVVVIDTFGCGDSTTVTIGQQNAEFLSHSSFDVLCKGDSTGLIQTFMSNATGATYLWSNGETTADIDSLKPGFYSVTVTDLHSCIITDSATIIEPTDTIAIFVSKQDVLCNGDSTGNITLIVTGGTVSVDYICSWSNGGNTNTLTNLTPGTYTVTVTDDFNCNKIKSITITEPPPLVFSPTTTKPGCGLSNGSIDPGVSGGSGGYNYFWSPTGQTTAIATNLVAGIYSVTVTDGNGCQKSRTFLLNTLTPPSLSLNTTNITCNGKNDGTITAVTPATQFQWSTGSTANNIIGLAPGPYSVTVTDINNCVNVAQTNITQPQAIILVDSSIDESCAGKLDGAAFINVSGGTAPYTYLWSNGDTTSSITNLAGGNYSVLVIDKNICQKAKNFTVNHVVDVDFEISVIDAACNSGGSTTSGSATIFNLQGSGSYDFLWSTVPSQNTITATGLKSGIYTVTVTDQSNGCFATKQATVNNIDAPGALIDSVRNITCNGGSDGYIEVSLIANEVPPFKFTWSTGLQDSILQNVPADTFTVTVSDRNNCKSFLTFILTEPPPYQLVKNIKQPTCSNKTDGEINLSVNGNTPFFYGYNYSWSTGAVTEDLTNIGSGTYIAAITDSLNCPLIDATVLDPITPITMFFSSKNANCGFPDGEAYLDSTNGGTAPYSFVWSTSPTDTMDTLKNLSSGYYSLTITDSATCQFTDSVLVGTFGGPKLTYLLSDVKCFGDSTGFITMMIDSGTYPYTVNWSNGDTDSLLTNLQAGTFIVDVSDTRNCHSTDTVVITEPPLLTVNNLITNIRCNGQSNGKIDLTVNGGTTPYSYSWSNSATTQDISALPANNYTVIVADSNNCRDTSAYVVTQPAVLTLTRAKTNVICFGENSGSIDLTVTGGTDSIGVYNYSWSNGATTEDISSLIPGTYTVTVTDSNSCKKNISTNITEPADIIIDSLITQIKCFGDSTGAIDLTASGGNTGRLKYLWSNGDSVADISKLPSNIYKVIVSDTKNCKDSATILITQPGQILLDTIVTPILCNGLSTGAIDLSVNGGIPNFSFSWSNAATTEDVSNLTAGNYKVIVTDSNSCRDSISINLTQPSALVLDTIVTRIKCFGENTGVIDLNVTGATPNYFYLWSNGATTDSIFSLPANIYTATVTDLNSCKDSISVNLTQPTALFIDSIVTNLKCFEDNSGAINLNVNGGVPNYDFTWSNGDSSEDISNLPADTFIVLVNDFNNCKDSATFILTQPTDLFLDSVIYNATCNSTPTGSIKINVNGGTPNYIYSWSNGDNTDSIFNLTAQNYTVTVTDFNNCKDTLTATVSQPNPIDIISSSSRILCNGDSTANIDLTVNGGTPQFRFLWSRGDTTEDISNLKAGQYKVNVIDSNSCVDSLTVVITEPQPFTILMDSSDDCGAGSGTAEVFVTGGTQPYFYSWNNPSNDTSAFVSGLIFGNYTVTVVDSNGCTDSGKITILYGELPKLTAFPDTTITKGQTVTLQIDNLNFASIEWTPDKNLDNNKVANPNATPGETTVYFATITATNGCTANDSLIIKVENCSDDDILIPNAFTPNGDSKNEIYLVRGEDITSVISFSIFDRWGKVMFHRENFPPNTESNGWDGKDDKGKFLNPDVYVYIIEAGCPGGGSIFKKGNVTIIR